MTDPPLHGRSRHDDERAVPPDECVRCGAKTGKPWLPHWIPGATMMCDGEDPEAWKNGGPVDA